MTTGVVRRVSGVEVLAVVLVVALGLRVLGVDPLVTPQLRVGATVFVAVVVQALPFLVLGVLLSGVLTAYVSPAALRRVLPARTGAAVPVAVAAGVALPGCECASVPVARRLIARGVPDAVALAFLLAAPAVNPIVLVATAVAFPDAPEMVLARFVGSFATAAVVGWVWSRAGRVEWIAERVRRVPTPGDGPRWRVAAATARHDLVDAGGFLVLGGLAAAVLTTVVPAAWVAGLGEQVVLAVLVMAVLAVVMSLCSEGDAFVAASLSALPLLPRLVFLVVGPAVDLKLIALQTGTFGRAFALRFAPVTFVVAVLCGVGAGLAVGLP
ncbi:permease [Actinomycetospora termitidis]|uniref:Permease n=1 Tax=Actinomycetospora termitidis TaxID=3053470 RepID=A0ABT7MDG9_9PSEU|nr:permease [Actinomycetospora sp. Odt1-22]MDL5158721.1 permease [Actinomycetospora sp. Odt1-22]